MALSVIGAGFGRTGTLSLKHALEKLGLGPCYHMVSWMEHLEHSAHWRAAIRGGNPDWDALFEGYGAAVDFPVCSFYRELSEHYPEAKVILTTRDPERWYESARNTIYLSSTRGLEAAETPPEIRERLELVVEQVWGNIFDGRFEDEAHAIATLEKHQREVVESLPAERLLVYQVRQGWEPLCEFLGVDVPDEPFPKINTRAEFRERLRFLSNDDS